MRALHQIVLGFGTLAIAAQAIGAPQIAPFRTISLNDSHSIGEAMAVNAAIDALMATANSCHPRGLDAALRCACAATANVDRLRSVYHRTAARHPDWNKPNTIVAYKNSANGHFISLNFAATNGMIARCETR